MVRRRQGETEWLPDWSLQVAISIPLERPSKNTPKETRAGEETDFWEREMEGIRQEGTE